MGAAVGGLLGESLGIGVGAPFTYVGSRVGRMVGASLGEALGFGVGTLSA